VGRPLRLPATAAERIKAANCFGYSLLRDMGDAARNNGDLPQGSEG
jgi:hypothetical protein